MPGHQPPDWEERLRQSASARGQVDPRVTQVEYDMARDLLVVSSGQTLTTRRAEWGSGGGGLTTEELTTVALPNSSQTGSLYEREYREYIRQREEQRIRDGMEEQRRIYTQAPSMRTLDPRVFMPIKQGGDTMIPNKEKFMLAYSCLKKLFEDNAGDTSEVYISLIKAIQCIEQMMVTSGLEGEYAVFEQKLREKVIRDHKDRGYQRYLIDYINSGMTWSATPLGQSFWEKLNGSVPKWTLKFIVAYERDKDRENWVGSTGMSERRAAYEKRKQVRQGI